MHYHRHKTLAPPLAAYMPSLLSVDTVQCNLVGLTQGLGKDSVDAVDAVVLVGNSVGM